MVNNGLRLYVSGGVYERLCVQRDVREAQLQHVLFSAVLGLEADAVPGAEERRRVAEGAAAQGEAPGAAQWVDARAHETPAPGAAPAPRPALPPAAHDADHRRPRRQGQAAMSASQEAQEEEATLQGRRRRTASLRRATPAPEGQP